MAELSTQNYANHVRRDPLFHFFLVPVFIITLIGFVVTAFQHPSVHSMWMVVVAIAFVVLVFKTRLYALKVQDRVIRLEERLRLQSLLQEPLPSRIGELTLLQMVALRFASDAEVPSLLQEALAKNMDPKEIKKSIKQWRADEFRV